MCRGRGGLILATPTKLWMQTGRARRRVSLYLQKAGAPEPARLENAFDFQTGRFSGLPIFGHHTDPQSIDIHLALLINKAGVVRCTGNVAIQAVLPWSSLMRAHGFRRNMPARRRSCVSRSGNQVG